MPPLRDAKEPRRGPPGGLASAEASAARSCHTPEAVVRCQRCRKAVRARDMGTDSLCVRCAFELTLAWAQADAWWWR